MILGNQRVEQSVQWSRKASCWRQSLNLAWKIIDFRRRRRSADFWLKQSKNRMCERRIHTPEGRKAGRQAGGWGWGVVSCAATRETEYMIHSSLVWPSPPSSPFSDIMLVAWNWPQSESIYSMEIGRHYKGLFVPVLPINHSPAYHLMEPTLDLTWGKGISVLWTSWRSPNVMCLVLGYHALDEGSLETIYSSLLPVIKEETQNVRKLPKIS